MLETWWSYTQHDHWAIQCRKFKTTAQRGLLLPRGVAAGQESNAVLPPQPPRVHPGAEQLTPAFSSALHQVTLCKSRQRWLMRHALFLSTHQWFKEQRQNTLILMMPARSCSRAGQASCPGGCWAEGSAWRAGQEPAASLPGEPFRQEGHRAQGKRALERDKNLTLTTDQFKS